jgi:hypothetical protein
MAHNIDEEIADLRQMTAEQLRARHGEVCGRPACSAHKQHLVRRIAWWLQALAEGDLSLRARLRAEQLVRDADPLTARPPSPATSTARAAARRDARLPSPGALLVRCYRGQTLEVKVLARGFEYDDRIYASLTAVAREITGKHWNGYHFFGLGKEKKQT